MIVERNGRPWVSQYETPAYALCTSPTVAGPGPIP